MKSFDSRSWSISLTLLGLFTSFSMAGAAGTGSAEAHAVSGSATWSAAGGAPKPLQAGTLLPEGAVVRSGYGSAVDIALGGAAGTVRMTQNSMLVIEKLQTAEIGSDNLIELSVPEGTVLGFDNRLSTAAKYRIKVPTGIVAVGAKTFRINARGYQVALDGTLVFAYVPPGGEPVAHTVHAPPPSYFSPIEGVRPAPAALIKEVEAQVRPDLPPK